MDEKLELSLNVEQVEELEECLDHYLIYLEEKFPEFREQYSTGTATAYPFLRQLKETISKFMTP